jgi:hypothetical protein
MGSRRIDMRFLYVLPLVLLTACPELVIRFVHGDDDDTGADDSGTGGGEPSDDDADGFSVEDGDCDDADPTIYPGAPDTSDGVDNDCDGEVDEDDTGRDTGGGGFVDDSGGGGGIDTGPRDSGKDTGRDTGGGGGWIKDADADGWSTAAGDCDDADPSVYPGAKEVKDGIDNDCDGDIDEPAGGGKR